MAIRARGERKKKRRKRTSKRQTFDPAKSLKVAENTGELIIGSNETIRQLSVDTLKLIVVAENAPDDIRQNIDLLNNALDDPVPIYEIPMSSWDLGAVLGKPFMIATLAVLDEGESQIMKVTTEDAASA